MALSDRVARYICIACLCFAGWGFSGCALLGGPEKPFAFKPVLVDFSELHHYGDLAQHAYDTDEQIIEHYGERLVAIRNLPAYDGKYFIIRDEASKVLLVSIRGTANLRNACIDAEYEKVADDQLDLFLHSGFKKMTDALYADLRPRIAPYHAKGYRLHITGHSLGGAMAAIVMLYLDHDGYQVGKVITFGQPKITNRKGADRYRDAPLTRVIDDRDVIPLLPPLTLISETHGRYDHFGPEIVLLKEEYFSYLDTREAEDFQATSFWHNIANQCLEDHHMGRYMERIRPKLDKQREVPFDKKKEYE